MAKQTLDLYELFRLVVSKGGLVEVINKKLWREITKGLNLPSSITSAAFTLRTQSVQLVSYRISSAARYSGWELLGGGLKGFNPPPVHVYRRSFLSENRFNISIHVQNFKHFDI